MRNYKDLLGMPMWLLSRARLASQPLHSLCYEQATIFTYTKAPTKNKHTEKLFGTRHYHVLWSLTISFSNPMKLVFFTFYIKETDSHMLSDLTKVTLWKTSTGIWTGSSWHQSPWPYYYAPSAPKQSILFQRKKDWPSDDVWTATSCVETPGPCLL